MVNRESLFQMCQPISYSLARRLLYRSFKYPSAYGCWDPVKVRADIQQIFKEYKNKSLKHKLGNKTILKKIKIKLGKTQFADMFFSMQKEIWSSLCRALSTPPSLSSYTSSSTFLHPRRHATPSSSTQSNIFVNHSPTLPFPSNWLSLAHPKQAKPQVSHYKCCLDTQKYIIPKKQLLL